MNGSGMLRQNLHSIRTCLSQAGSKPGAHLPLAHAYIHKEFGSDHASISADAMASNEQLPQGS